MQKTTEQLNHQRPTYEDHNLLLDSNVDNNLKKQLHTYQQAIFSGDVDLAYSFLYEGILSYLKTTYPDENPDEEYIKENLLKSVYSAIEEDDSFKNANFEYVIKDIACKYQEKGSLLFVINSSLDAKFLAIDEDLTKPVLSQAFDLNAVAEVLNCK